MDCERLQQALSKEMKSVLKRFPDGIYPRDGSAPIWEMMSNSMIGIESIDEAKLSELVNAELAEVK